MAEKSGHRDIIEVMVGNIEKGLAPMTGIDLPVEKTCFVVQNCVVWSADEQDTDLISAGATWLNAIELARNFVIKDCDTVSEWEEIDVEIQAVKEKSISCGDEPVVFHEVKDRHIIYRYQISAVPPDIAISEARRRQQEDEKSVRSFNRTMFGEVANYEL